MRPYLVVGHPPLLDKHLRLPQRVEDLTVEQLVPQLPVEAFVVTVLPWAPRLNEESLRSDPLDPVPNSLGRELRSVIRPDVFGYTSRAPSTR